MKLSRMTLVTITLALLTAACTGSGSVVSNKPATPAPNASASPDQFATTRATFAKRCAVCHGENGGGGTATVEGKKIKAPSLRAGHALSHPDADFVKQITKGGDGMPAFGDKLSPKEIDDLVHFIRHDFQGGRSPQANSNMKM
jgi:mono/diheme cytochrome c family protein